jgi:hypothetical protein
MKTCFKRCNLVDAVSTSKRHPITNNCAPCHDLMLCAFYRGTRRNWMEIGSRRCVSPTNILSLGTLCLDWNWCTNWVRLFPDYALRNGQVAESHEKGCHLDSHFDPLQSQWVCGGVCFFTNVQVLQWHRLEIQHLCHGSGFAGILGLHFYGFERFPHFCWSSHRRLVLDHTSIVWNVDVHQYSLGDGRVLLWVPS